MKRDRAGTTKKKTIRFSAKVTCDDEYQILPTIKYELGLTKQLTNLGLSQYLSELGQVKPFSIMIECKLQN